MNLGDFKVAVLNYGRLQGQDLEDDVVKFLNQVILEFMRKKEWDKTIKRYTLTLTGSDNYDLNSLVSPDYFHSIHDLIRPGTNQSKKQFMRLDLRNYFNLSSTQNAWAFQNGVLYYSTSDNTQSNTAELEVFYQTPGEGYPLVDDADEPQIMIDYIDILEKMTIIKMLGKIGDMEQMIMENQLLQGMLNDLRKDENRARKVGKVSSFGSFNR